MTPSSCDNEERRPCSHMLAYTISTLLAPKSTLHSATFASELAPWFVQLRLLVGVVRLVTQLLFFFLDVISALGCAREEHSWRRPGGATDSKISFRRAEALCHEMEIQGPG